MNLRDLVEKKLSFAVSGMWQRWVRRSSKAVVILASPNAVAQSLTSATA
jgi:hypothetical protein